VEADREGELDPCKGGGIKSHVDPRLPMPP
jgi:hypothetical protein